MTSSSTPSASGGSDPMSFRVCGLGWRREWPCTTFASGSTSNLVDLVWPSPTCWDGDLTIHTKRFQTTHIAVVLAADGLAEPTPAFELVWQLHAAAFALALPALGATFIGAALATHAS